MRNSENLGARITENRALDRKIWAPLEAFRGKMVFSGVLWGFLEFWRGWRVLAQKARALAKFVNFSGIFGEFLGYLEWLESNPKYFSEIEGPTVFSKCVGTVVKFTRSSGALMQNGKELWIPRIYFPTENLVDRATWLRPTTDRGSADKRVRRRPTGVWALGLVGAHWQRRRRMGRARWCRRGAHQSTRGDGEAA
jgi:hypothetical protein